MEIDAATATNARPEPTRLTNASAKPPRAPAKQMGKEEFLKLLVTQLAHQDPLNPMEDKEFVAQLAQFSSLEQLMAMNRSMEGQQRNRDTESATTFLGRTVKVVDPQTKTVITGRVSEVVLTETDPRFKIGDRLYPRSSIVGIVADEGERK
jgi:flagellar basal-body rod modification protein FlgD